MAGVTTFATARGPAIALAGMLVVLLAGLWWWSAREPANAPSGAVPSGPNRAESGADPEVATGPGQGRTKERASPAADDREPVARTLQIVGRCVDTAGQSKPGVRLSLRLRRYEMEETCWEFPGAAHVPPRIEWRPPAAQLAGQDGRFAFVMPWTDLPLRIDAAAPHAVSRDCTRLFTELRETDVYDAGDVVVRSGAKVAGTVVDQHGRPVSGALLMLGGAYGGPVAEVHGGRVDFGAVVPDEFGVSCTVGTVSPERIVVGGGNATDDVAFVVERLDVLACLFVDDRTGAPVPGMRLQPELRHAEVGHGRPWTVFANDEGRVWLRASSAQPEAVRFDPDDDDPESTHYVVDTQKWYEFRDREVKVRVRAWPRFLVRVQDAAGNPVESFEIVTTSGDPRLVEEREPETWLVSDVKPGRHFVYAHVEDQPLQATEVRTFDPTDHVRSPLVLTVGKPAPFRVEVVDRKGAPVEAKVTMQRRHPDEAAGVEWNGGGRWSYDGKLSAGGSVTLQAPPDVVGWEVVAWRTDATETTTLVCTAGHQARRFVQVVVAPR